MGLLFFLRCVETAFAIIGMNMSLTSLKKNARFRIIISVIMLLVSCSLITILYISGGVEMLEKIYIPIIIFVIGAFILNNLVDKFWVIFFNFFTQFLLYEGISMACTMFVRQLPAFESGWIYLLMRAVAFSVIILIEVKYIRKPFRYFVQIIDFDWHIFSILIVVFSFLILLLSTYPVMYYDRPLFAQIEIIVAYILLTLVLYTIYLTFRNTVQKYELLQSEISMKGKVKYMEKYKRLSEIDSLTGLLNRSTFIDQVEHHINEGEPSALLMMDIDNFKQINDNFGHNVGDDVLRVLSFALKTSFRSMDIIARFGGDEFIVLMINLHNDDNIIKQKIEVFNQNMHKLIVDSNMIPDFSVSIGVTYVNDKTDFEKIYKNADIALYRAKKDGKRCTVFY